MCLDSLVTISDITLLLKFSHNHYRYRPAVTCTIFWYSLQISHFYVIFLISNADIALLFRFSDIHYRNHTVINIFWYSLQISPCCLDFFLQISIFLWYSLQSSSCCLDSLIFITDIVLLWRFSDIHYRYHPVV